jgi:hypothetical protein
MKQWSKDIELILDKIRFNSVIMSEEHKLKYIYLKGLLRYFRLPIILLSGINSVISVGLQPYIEQSYISVINCIISLGCGIIGSIELFLGIQVQMENELLVSKEYYILSTTIFKMLSLNIKNRNVNGHEFLEHCFDEYSNLIEKSNIIVNKIIDKLIPLEDILNPGFHIEDVENDINSFVPLLPPLQNDIENHLGETEEKETGETGETGENAENAENDAEENIDFPESFDTEDTEDPPIGNLEEFYYMNMKHI